MLFTVALLYSPCVYQNAFAMGAKGNVVREQGLQNDAARESARREAVHPEGGLPSREYVPGKGEKAAPAKKPRLKYRDETTCAC